MLVDVKIGERSWNENVILDCGKKCSAETVHCTCAAFSRILSSIAK